MTPHATAVLLSLGIIILSQWMGVLAKLALFEVPAFTFVWLQLASALGFMLIYTFGIRRERWPASLAPREWAAIVFVGFANFGACRLFMMLGIERLPMNTFVFILSFVSLATMGMSVVFLGERPGRVQLFGLVFAIIGVRIFFADVPPPRELTGVAYASLVVILLAACNNVTRWLMNQREAPISPTLFATLGLMIGGIPLVLFGIATDADPAIGSPRNGVIIVANGIVGIALAQTVFNAILKTLRSYEASVLASSGLVWTALLAIPILGEWLELRQVAAIAVVLTGVLMAQKRAVA